MRGRELLQLIKSLTSREQAYVKASFASVKNGAEWTTLFDGMLRLKTFNKKTLSKSGSLSERRISALLPAFSRHVVRAVGNFQPNEPTDFELEMNTAWKMVMRLQNGPAQAIMQDLYHRALEVERFDILLELHELSDIITEPVSFPGPARAEIVRKQHNIAAFEDLRAQFLRIKFGSVQDRKEVLDLARSSVLLSSEQQALSTRALAMYCWLKTRQNFYSGDANTALQYQERIISMLRDHEWLKRERDFYLLKEHEPLIAFLFNADRDAEANAMIFKVGNLPAKQDREELMKWQQIFPMRLAHSIQSGDPERGEAAVSDFQSILEQHESILPRRFVTKNQYWIIYHHLANGNFDLARNHSVRLMKSAKSVDFDTIYFPMTRLVSAILSYELGEHEDLHWQEKTFRMTTAYQEAPYYKFVLDLLKKLSGARSAMHQKSLLEEYQLKSDEFESDHANRRFFSHFDLGVWIESKQRKCSMLEVFESRALSSARDEGSITANHQ